MNTFIAKLAEVCREHVVREKWLIAPSLRVGNQWLDQVTRAGSPVLNLHVHTVRSLAMKALGPQLTDGSLAVASPAVRRLVVAAAWQSSMTDDGYLGSARLTPGLLALAESSLADLRLAGLGPDDVKAAAFEQSEKGRELGRLLAAYRDELKRRKLIDHADAARLAAERWRGSRPDVLVLRPDDLQLAAVESTLLDAMADATIRLDVDEPAGDAAPASVDTDLALLAWLERPASAPQAPGDGSVRITHAVGEANEVRGVLRACLAGDIALDTVEVLYTSAEPYASLIYEIALRLFDPAPEQDLDVPVTFADGVPARLSRPGRLLAAWHSWVYDGFPQSGLLRMLHAGLLQLPVDAAGDPVNRAQVVRMLRSIGIGMGRERYLSCIDEKIEAVREQIERARTDGAADHHKRRLDAAIALRGLVERLLAASPDPGAGALQVVSAAVVLIRDHADIGGRLDGFARQRFLKELIGMREALGADEVGPVGFDGWVWVSELPEQVTVGGSGPRPGHLHVASVRSGGHSGRARTFIVGLDDGRFPSAGRQDPLLLDGERRRMKTRLQTSTERLREQVEHCIGLLCRLRGTLMMSFPSRSVEDGREMFAGPIVLDTYRLLSGDRGGDHGALMSWLAPAISFAPRDDGGCLDEGEWWLHQAACETPAKNLAALAEDRFAHLAEGRVASAARSTDLFTVFDGRVEQPGAELDARKPEGPVLSATTWLQTLGKCPLQYFYSRVLGICAPEDVEVDPSVWLDNLKFGTLLHDVLFDFVALLIDEKAWPPDPARDAPRMAAIVESRVAAQRRLVPPPSEDAYLRQRQELDQTVAIFINEQARRPGPGRPVYLEASIGMPTEARGTDLDAPEPVEIDLPGGGRIRARARIDRIDRSDDGDGHAHVIYDYKSGGYTKIYDPDNPFQKGRVVQHVLYMAIARAALRAKVDPAAVVDEFRFLFPGIRTYGREIPFGSDLVEDGLDVIKKLCRTAADGAFTATTDHEEDCRYCDYRPTCQAVQPDLGELAAAARRKLANPDNTVLQSFAELRRD